MKTLIYSPEPFNQIIGITNGNLKLIEAKNLIVDKLVRKYHYSHKTTKNRSLSMIVNDNKGFIQLGYGIYVQV